MHNAQSGAVKGSVKENIPVYEGSYVIYDAGTKIASIPIISHAVIEYSESDLIFLRKS
jgi:hypothetical protein